MSTNTSKKSSSLRNNHPLAMMINRYGFRLLGTRLPRLMSWWALRLWSQTHRFDPPARELRLQLRASECPLTVNGIKIKAWEWGKGPTVLLVHGWNGRGMQLGRFVDPLLSAGYRVITFDAPGHGQSDGTRTHLAQISDVIQALAKKHGAFHSVIGHSFGVAGVSAAISSGMAVQNLIALSSPGGLSNLIERYCQAMLIPEATEQYLRQRLEKRIGSELWQRFADSYPLDSGVERSLIIHDKDDSWVDWQESEQLSECWPNPEFVLTEGLGHRRILRDPSLLRYVVSFIDIGDLCDPLD
ncbi:MAG: alpha/beta hydrolase [Sulfuriflexus sp.]|nr:alpha/beta hydrolase [Sulfuriflexus sp.]